MSPDPLTLKQHKLTVSDAAIEAGRAAFGPSALHISDQKLERVYLAMHQASIPTEATGDDVEQLLKWHIPSMLRWLAENIEAPRLPDGTLTGRFLYAVAENIEARATLSPNRVSQSVVERGAAKEAKMPEKARIWWGEDRIRQGWFFSRDGNDHWIHGPSICESSGGGPLAAIAVAHRQHGPLGEFTIEVPPHLDTLDRPCIWCEPKVRDVIAALATQSATDTRIPVNEEATDLQKLCAKVEADAVSGLRYIERHYGRLEGVGWDRVFEAHDELFKRAEAIQSIDRVSNDQG